MDWVQITANDAKTLLTDYEWDAIVDATREASASNLVTTTINRVVNRVRGYVESCPANVLGAAGYIPALLWDSTLILIIEALAKSIPASNIVLDDGRRKQITEALNELKMVARCELKISPPGSTQDLAADSPAQDTGGYGGCDPVNFHNTR